ncbi:hypothetical protein T484DRAFT_1914142, partial [Baffinella frigidus]
MSAAIPDHLKPHRRLSPSRVISDLRREVPLAIVATIDGSLVAVKADTGSHIWTLGLGDVLLSTWQNKTVFKDNIIIPNTDGSLFLFAGNDAGLQRLPITLQDLVEHSPFMADDGSVYVAEKKSQFYVVDRLTGKILAEVASGDLNATETYSPRSSSCLLVGRYQYRVKAVNPRTHHVAWRATLSYIPTVRAIRPAGDDTVGQPSIVNDPGSYFYHQNTLYAVNRATGDLGWWLSVPAPPMAVHVIGDGEASEERFLLPSNAPLSGEVDLWNSRMLIADDVQFVQVFGGQPFAVNGVLEPPRRIAGDE